MSNYIGRMNQEKKELDVKIERLSEFMLTDDFAALERVDFALLMLQRRVMEQYSDTLGCRIERAEDNE